MNNQESKHNMKDEILGAIKKGQVAMRPKWQFILHTTLIVAGTALVFLLALFMTSFIVFALRRHGNPPPVSDGLADFFTSLPWIMVALAILFIVLLEILVRRYSFAYGKPLLYSALGIIALVILGGLLIGRSSFHDRMFEQAERDRLPFGRHLYERYGPRREFRPPVPRLEERQFLIPEPR